MDSIKIYLDNILVNSSNNQFNNNDLANTNLPLSIGRLSYSEPISVGNERMYFNGKIDDIGIWNRALTDQEITALFNSSTAGINEVSENNLFSVYPNPAHSLINVNIDAKLVGSVFTIYDSIGKAVKTGKLNSVNTTIELNDLSGGIYTFNLGENRKQTFKVIKE